MSINRFDELCQRVVNPTASNFPAGNAIVERKHDGIRALWLNEQLVTRSGVPIWSTAHLWSACAGLESALGGGFMLDAEYTEPGGFADTAARFSAGLVDGRPVAGSGSLDIFDAVPLDVWSGKAAGAMLWQRKLRLREAFDDGDDLRFVPDVRVASADQALALAVAAYARGEEGIVVKDAASLHRAGPSPAWQRYKRSMTVDLPVIGHAPLKGDGDLLGALVVDHAGKAVRVSVGFSDRERALYYHEPDRLIGRIAEIGAMEATDNGSLRSARFLRFRDDKGVN